ncbi:hypothetical protein STRCI_005473 [Streptomyces cinnabarinus]|uniref:Uncharacterized protein n=1 Tax=Streptomyces cinnabarinus TaxID=67287 RepID=A0ABY7KIB1_9ACTN|nr:hypothetical protein [Streptomyces cinnabarinus]WAZ24084.1 hypothetical protein STRCI_005473 [Streptomyces cinnabarinus]
MSTELPRTGPASGGPAPGALLLCRAEPEFVAPAAHLLREPMLLVPAGGEWSVLVPESRPWADGEEPVDRVLTGWATALAVGAPWPVLALWWDGDRAGYTLASGFRRPVGYIWLSDGTPVGEDEAMRTFATRLSLDPVLDMESLEQLTRTDSGTDARARLGGLLAVLTRAGVTLPAGLAPGDSADRLVASARVQPQVRAIERTGWREAVRSELDAVRAELDSVDASRLGTWLPWSGTPLARALAFTQIAAGLPLTALGLHRRSAGWAVAGALLLAHGALGLAYDVTRPRD